MDDVAAFIDAACAPLDGGHATGTLEQANAILAAHPDLPARDINAAAVLGDEAAIRRFIADEATSATRKSGPRQWDPLTYLCFSRYLRLDRSRSTGFVRAATALLDAGADPNTGWWEPNHQPKPEWESAIYGAAGVAKNAELTRLLLARGADPNDQETPYHAPETYDNAALKALLESGKLTDDSLGMMLLRKTDWHDYHGVQLLLEHGVDTNRITRWGKTALHNAVLSDNDLAIVELLLNHRADPTIVATRPDRSGVPGPGASSFAIAARRGRRDVLSAFLRHGFAHDLHGIDRVLALCALNASAELRRAVAEEPAAVDELRTDGGVYLARFAGNGNIEAVWNLLDIGVPIDALHKEGEGYFDIATDSTALHVAAWRAQHKMVRFLIEHGAMLDRADGKGRTPLALAIKACVDSYWMERRSTESIEALLSAGASRAGIAVPTGYPDADAVLLRATPSRDQGTMRPPV